MDDCMMRTDARYHVNMQRTTAAPVMLCSVAFPPYFGSVRATMDLDGNPLNRRVFLVTIASILTRLRNRG